MQFKLMGSFEVVTGSGMSYAPQAPKICRMLAVLALQPRETVGAETLIQELWGENPPRGALRTLQTHVYHARRMLAEVQGSSAGRQLIVTKAPGYQLDIDDGEVDVRRFERLIRRAQWELDNNEVARASDHLARAMALWRGRFLGNIPIGSVLVGSMARVEELRIRALELTVESENRLGRYKEFLPDLRELVEEYPLHEWFHGQLILALHRSGRRGDALRVYQNLYRVLKKELNLEPSTEIRQLQANILASERTG